MSIDSLWKHFLKFYENGYCCKEDMRLETEKYVITKWSSDLLFPLKEDLKQKSLTDGIITRLYLAGEFFEIPNLIEDTAYVISSVMDDMCDNRNEHFDI